MSVSGSAGWKSRNLPLGAPASPALLSLHHHIISHITPHHNYVFPSNHTTLYPGHQQEREGEETGRWGGEHHSQTAVSGPQPISQYLGGRLQGCQSYLTISARLLCHIFSDPRHATAAAGCTAGKCRICPTRFTQPDRLPLVGGMVWCWWCGVGGGAVVG